MTGSGWPISALTDSVLAPLWLDTPPARRRVRH